MRSGWPGRADVRAVVSHLKASSSVGRLVGGRREMCLDLDVCISKVRTSILVCTRLLSVYIRILFGWERGAVQKYPALPRMAQMY